MSKYKLRFSYINEIEINEDIFHKELFEYSIIRRKDFLDELCQWISEATKDKELMKADFKMLINRDDEYMFSSVSTNKYVGEGDDEYDELCEELLEINRNYESKNKITKRSDEAP